MNTSLTIDIGIFWKSEVEKPRRNAVMLEEKKPAGFGEDANKCGKK